jgi:5'-3' exonuclease
VTHRLILDVSSLMYRAFFALRDGVYTADGRPVNAVHGYLDMVARLVASRHPDEVVHAYDHDWRPVARTDIYPAYKGNRQEDPPELPPQFDLLREVLGPTGMLQAQTEGWEAEDAIGAFCLDAREDDRIEIVSGDRDLIQLVRDPVVKLLFTVRGVSELLEFDEAGVFAKYGVAASRYLEFAILRGDPSDGLPGVKGVGEKTARELILAYPSIDAMLEEAAAGRMVLKPSLRPKLLEARDYLDAMRELVPINADAPMTLWAGERDDATLRAMADELALRGPVQRLLAALDAARSG